MFHVEQIATLLSSLGFEPNKPYISKLYRYVNLFLEWNSVHNISSVRDEEVLFRDHIFDSLVFASCLKNINEKTIIDIGSGNGLPGLVLAIMLNKQIVLIDSNRKKSDFMEYLVRKLDLSNTKVAWSKFENFEYPENKFVLTNRALGMYDKQFLFFSKTNISSFYFMLTKKVLKSVDFDLSKKYGFGGIVDLSRNYKYLQSVGVKYTDKVIINVPRGTFILQE